MGRCLTTSIQDQSSPFPVRHYKRIVFDEDISGVGDRTVAQSTSSEEVLSSHSIKRNTFSTYGCSLNCALGNPYKSDALFS